MRNIEEGSHQSRSKNRGKRLEERCEDKPSMKKFWIEIGGGAVVRNLNVESKIVKTAEKGGGGNAENLSNGTYHEDVG